MLEKKLIFEMKFIYDVIVFSWFLVSRIKNTQKKINRDD